MFLRTGVAQTNITVQDRPNVIVIMADDLGYGDLSCYGATEFATPHIDQLASEGIRFTSGYCSASTCTPTRYSFLTGTYAFRREGTGIAPPNSPALIPAGTTTLPSLLQQAGYRTAVIGKWHLGLGERGAGPDWNGQLNPGPLEIGFDHCFLLPTTNDRVPQVYVQDHQVLNLDPNDPLWVGDQQPSPDHPTGKSHRQTLKMDWSHGHNATIHNGISRIGFYTGGHAARFRDEDLADRWVDESVKWMEANQDQPFFLFFSSHDLHVPRVPHERFQGQTKCGPRADSIVQLDWCVGELMAALKRLNLEEKTLVVFCSDNGPVLDDGYKDDAIEKLGSHKPNGPFRGGKYNVLEGGTRTPFITRWTGRIQPGVSDQIVCTVDLAASCAALVNQPLPQDACLDSMNVLPTLLGQADASGRNHLIQQDNGRSGSYGLRIGKWKLQRYDSKGTTNVELRLTRTKMPQFQLFDLEQDPAEQHDLSEQHPEIAGAMRDRLKQLIQAGRSRDVTLDLNFLP
ncbi:MAG: arylsulfatase [Pirellulaceae bacterium]